MVQELGVRSLPLSPLPCPPPPSPFSIPPPRGALSPGTSSHWRCVFRERARAPRTHHV